MRTDNLFTLAIFWKKKWEGGEAGSAVDSHVLSQQMQAVGPHSASPWRRATACWHGATHPERNTTTPRSPSFSQATWLLVHPVPSTSLHSKSHHWPLWGWAGCLWRTTPTFSSGGAGLQSLVWRLWDVELPGFIPKGCYMLPVHLSRPSIRAAETKASAAIGGCSTLTEWEVTGLKRYQQLHQPHKLHPNKYLQMAPNSHRDLSFRCFPSHRAMRHGTMQLRPGGLIASLRDHLWKIGAGSRTQFQASPSLRVLRFELRITWAKESKAKSQIILLELIQVGHGWLFQREGQPESPFSNVT